MEMLTTLKTLHVLATVLLLGSALGLVIWIWRARRQGDGALYSRILQRPALFAWALMAVCLFSLPFTGWQLAHRVGWPLGQIWILGSSVLYTLGALAWLWLLVRLNRLRVAKAASGLRFTLVLAVFSFICFFAIAGLMGAKPV
ncbi:hypothetical protein BK634_01355 [Pseudomonas chlororaphis]|jgi:uncharacterized membrane protein|uniref:DUF2269 domain-containing protein n=1 Tax=Pseudomonas morbosilactucae TaxID=2938197 RepID=A0A9X1Z2D4_9PSED|nr:DUF2269 domain-containing protein [Pseudomonas morbosilactucae]MCK9801242.1 DUF2269 domain-containing protein [Pseudomonas morbosilactucae]MCK9816014.1 DUF2269 domain-containing protein [Pseudomonas morbosilactucae]ROL73394.1 hypothetical protein BK634_01355 [Pseudomonas chlororaphis]WEK09680.1 MAG: DUF2269 domain-containing protein [Pseudomonas sp.]